MEEQGEIARFAAKAPRLTELPVPNAPDSGFFQVPLPHLSMLRIGGGDVADKTGIYHAADMCWPRSVPALLHIRYQCIAANGMRRHETRQRWS
ncbi:hypothetical protein P3W85_07970 [Cupriavidus basilensis]|uniref:Uncharacterized protein n=1 Tax=Cupriavidus basilensis TaxID=68895 RepID=A0ABT6AJU7_9BURK|nr:hypothetical protein [Cupriavidus basilensis]MDF3832882.1 hypothetical protein [Cupriavidus basilensis]